MRTDTDFHTGRIEPLIFQICFLERFPKDFHSAEMGRFFQSYEAILRARVERGRA